jgi:hypothetical protein
MFKMKTKKNKMISKYFVLPSILARCDSGSSSKDATIYLTAYDVKDRTVGMYSVHYGTIIRKNKFKMVDIPQSRFASRATVDSAMAFICMEAVKDAMGMGGVNIRLIYKNFEMLERNRQGLKPERDLAYVLQDFFRWAEDNGVRFSYSNEDSPRLTELKKAF